MIATGIPVTFRDGAKFAKLGTKVQGIESKFIANGGAGGYQKLRRARNEFREFSEKLVEKSVPEIMKGYREDKTSKLYSGGLAEIDAQDCRMIAESITNRDKPGNEFIYKLIGNVDKYKNGEDAKFSLRGQTLSSILDHFATKSKVLMNYQGNLAQMIFDGIKANVAQRLDEKGIKL